MPVLAGSTVSLEDVEKALAEGMAVDDVLDLADDVIDHAAETGDRRSLLRLAALLDDAAGSGKDVRGFAVAAQRASAAAAALEVAPPWPAAAVTTVHPPEAEAAAIVRYAGWWKRVIVFAVDWFVLGMAFSVIPSDASDGVWLVALLVLPVAYFSGFHALVHGQTIGKALFGIAVRLDDGQPVDLSRAMVRALVQGVLWITVIGGIFDALMPLGERRNRALHDRAAGTVVVRAR